VAVIKLPEEKERIPSCNKHPKPLTKHITSSAEVSKTSQNLEPPKPSTPEGPLEY